MQISRADDLPITSDYELIRDRLTGDKGQVSLLFESFGFKSGVPRDVDFVFDAELVEDVGEHRRLVKGHAAFGGQSVAAIASIR